MNLTARSGGCGAGIESVATQSSQPTAVEAPCTGTIGYSANNCDVTMDATCPAGSDGSLARMVGKVTWNEAGTSGSGILALTVKTAAGDTTCHGTYDAKYTKL